MVKSLNKLLKQCRIVAPALTSLGELFKLSFLIWNMRIIIIIFRIHLNKDLLSTHYVLETCVGTDDATVIQTKSVFMRFELNE